jgi:hypothetical protein
VPAALTKDKKRIDGAELAVEAAWQSSLFVKNFPESLDDAGMKKLFSPVSPAWRSFVHDFGDLVWHHSGCAVAQQALQNDTPVRIHPVFEGSRLPSIASLFD